MVSLPTYLVLIFLIALLALPVLFLFGVLAGSFITYRSRVGGSPVPTVREIVGLARKPKEDPTESPNDERRKLPDRLI